MLPSIQETAQQQRSTASGRNTPSRHVFKYRLEEKCDSSLTLIADCDLAEAERLLRVQFGERLVKVKA